VYLYTLALPFTFIKELGWGTVPLMALVSFTLFGMEGIGREIENPFGKDANDLHMDDFCRDLKREFQYLVNLQNTVPGAHA
jgi:putative membrane protein